MTEPASSNVNRKSAILKIAMTLAVLGGLFALFRFLPVAAWIEAFKVWVAGQGALGVVAFALAYVGATRRGHRRRPRPEDDPALSRRGGHRGDGPHRPFRGEGDSRGGRGDRRRFPGHVPHRSRATGGLREGMIRPEPQMIVLAERALLHVPDLHLFTKDDLHDAVHAEAPNWVALDRAGVLSDGPFASAP